MIYSLKVVSTDPQRCVVPWWGEVPALKDRESIEFASGLNILFGTNGSGKSTVLSTLARLLHCEQGGVPVVTSDSLRVAAGWMSDPLKDGTQVDHDGSPTLHFDPGRRVGLIGSSFDDDFFSEGVREAMSHMSAGQHTMRRGMQAIGVVLGREEAPEVQWKARKAEDLTGKKVDSWQREDNERRLFAEAILKGRGAPDRPTVLLDEPDRSVDLTIQAKLWSVLENAGNHPEAPQIIVATHSPFALNRKAHYIDLDGTGEYREKVDSTLRSFFSIPRQTGE